MLVVINEIIVINKRGNSGKAHIIYRFSFIIAVMLINALYKGVTLSTCVLQ